MQLDLPGLANTSGFLPLFSRLFEPGTLPRNAEPRILTGRGGRCNPLAGRNAAVRANKKGGFRRPSCDPAAEATGLQALTW